MLWANGVFNLLGSALIVLLSERVGPELGVGHEAAFLWNIIAACSFGFAFHSVMAARSQEPGAIRIAVLTMLVFHLSTAAVAGAALLSGSSRFVIINLVLHLIFAALFAWERRRVR